MKKYYDMITAAWRLLKEFYPQRPRNWNRYAEALERDDIQAMAKTRFGRDLLQAVTEELKRT